LLAEGVGFEPTIRFPVYTLSKRAPSAARPSLRSSGIKAGAVRIGEADRSAGSLIGRLAELAISQWDATPDAPAQYPNPDEGEDEELRGRPIIGRLPLGAGRRMWASAARRAHRRRGPCWPTGTRSSSARRRRAPA